MPFRIRASFVQSRGAVCLGGPGGRGPLGSGLPALRLGVAGGSRPRSCCFGNCVMALTRLGRVWCLAGLSSPGLIWWIGKLGLIAVAPLVVVFGSYFGLYGWLLGKARTLARDPMVDRSRRWLGAHGGGKSPIPGGGVRVGTGRLHGRPVFLGPGGGAVGGNDGWSVVLVAIAAGIVVAIETRRLRLELLASRRRARRPHHRRGRCGRRYRKVPRSGWRSSRDRPLPAHPLLRRTAGHLRDAPGPDPDDSRPGSVDLVVWPEGSTGGFDADPILNRRCRRGDRRRGSQDRGIPAGRWRPAGFRRGVDQCQRDVRPRRAHRG